jgi:FkbM family methyltransferase
MQTKIDEGALTWIYGSGTFAIRVAEILDGLGWKIEGFIDHIPKSDFSIKGKNYAVEKPSEVKLNSSSQVILGVSNLHGDLISITKNISSVEPNVNIITPVELSIFLRSKDILLENYWMGASREFYERHSQEIANFRSLLEDLESKELFDKILKYRIDGLLNDLWLPDPLGEQYLPKGLETPPVNLRALDLGACQGENLEAFLESGRFFEFGIFLEPDLVNFDLLAKKIADLELHNILVWPLASWSNTEMLSFSSAKDTSANLNSAGLEKVQAIRLDSALPTTSINYIKMDIEGAEMETLRGARNLISKQCPHLAISVYHKPEDMWSLGLYVDSIATSKYRYYLRNYGHQTFDTILYCVPKSQSPRF